MTSPRFLPPRAACGPGQSSPPGLWLPWSARLFTRLSPGAACRHRCAGCALAPGIEVPGADGVPLVTDH